MARLIEAIRTNDLAAVRTGLESGAKANAQDDVTGYSALAIAADTGSPALVKILLEHGADPNYKHSVISPLTVCVGKGDRESAQLLLDAGAEIDVRDEDGGTPLMWAAAIGNRDLVQELVARGANPKLKDRFSKTALGYAAEKNFADVCEILMPLATPKECERTRITLEIKKTGGGGDDVKELIARATRGEFEGVVKLVESGVSADAINEQGISALMRAANKGHAELVRWLLEKGADVNRKDIYGEYPLSYAAMGCNPAIYDYLFPLTDKKLRKRAEKIKQNQIDIGNWPKDSQE